VLVQPSFLGTDNSFLVAALRTHPDRLRGIAVVAPDADLGPLDGTGIVGLRLNLIGQPDPDFDTGIWRTHLAEVARRGWQIEVQAEARRLPGVLPPLLAGGVDVVLDHFGKPDPTLGVEDPGFRYLLEAGAGRRVWVKLSGSYRSGGVERGKQIAAAAAPLLKRSFGLDRLLWGSDWPHTQFERATDYGTARALLDIWLPDADERRQVLVDTPARLFRF
jgi:predicted TIM-barrel fold metal-dependent hydrolase